MTAMLSLLLAAASPTQDMPIAVTVVTVESLKKDRKYWREQRRIWAPRCRKIYANRNDLVAFVAKSDYDSGSFTDLARHFEDGRYGCRKDEALAIALLEHLSGPGPVPRADDFVSRWLLGLYEQRPEYQAKSAALRRGMWLRGYGQYGPALQWSDEERRAFVAQPEVWAWLEAQPAGDHNALLKRLDALFDGASPRYDPGRGIAALEAAPSLPYNPALIRNAALMLEEGRGVPKDLARAESLLMRVVAHDDAARPALLRIIAPRLASKDPVLRGMTASYIRDRLALPDSGKELPGAKAARELLLPFYVARLRGVDTVAADDARETLAKFAEAKLDGAVPPLVAWIEKELQSKTFDERKLGWGLLARLSRAGYRAALTALDFDIRRTGGIVAVENIDELVGSVRFFISPDDYPASAMRAEEEGIVSAKALVTPEGRVVEAWVTKGASPRLDAEVVRMAIRRIRVKSSPYPGRYLMVTLPDIQFILPECRTDRKPEPKPGAIAVVGNYCPQPVQDVPIPVTVI